MKKITIAALVAMSASLAGCAMAMKPAKYDADHSRAYNIARAGDLYQVEDKAVPKADYEALESAMNAAGNALLFTSSSGLGLNVGEGLGLGLLTSALAHDGNAERNSFIAWMPANEAESTEDAQVKMLSHVKDAVEQTLAEMGASFDLVYENGPVAVYHFYGSNWSCPEWINGQSKVSDICIVNVRVAEPRKAMSPAFLGGASAPAYAFESAHATKYNRIDVANGRASHVPQQAFYATLSKHLPAWAYLYLAPETVVLETGEKVDFPYLLENGRPEFFVYPVE